MKCSFCGKEIACAKSCPYCGGYSQAASVRNNTNNSHKTPRGIWRGRMSRGQANTGTSFNNLLPAIYRYFRDPKIPWWRKGLILAGVLYVFSPFDLIPEVLPPLGFLDDVVVATITWKILSGELKIREK